MTVKELERCTLEGLVGELKGVDANNRLETGTGRVTGLINIDEFESKESEVEEFPGVDGRVKSDVILSAYETLTGAESGRNPASNRSYCFLR